MSIWLIILIAGLVGCLSGDRLAHWLQKRSARVRPRHRRLALALSVCAGFAAVAGVIGDQVKDHGPELVQAAYPQTVPTPPLPRCSIDPENEPGCPGYVYHDPTEP
jgi:hypothetical protein